MRNLLRRQTIGIIGLGTMGSAIARGLLSHGVSRARLRGAEARASQRKQLARTLRLRVDGDVTQVIRRSTIIVLAVKPQELAPVLDLVRATGAQPLVISIAAGVTTRVLERRLGRLPVMRAMPNTAARIGQSITAIARGRWATPQHLRIAHAIFRAVGDTVDVPERWMNAVTAVSGSGPAYFFWLTDQLSQAGEAAGLSRATAERLARCTIIGSAGLLAHSDVPAADLMQQVVSKRGTTAAALRVFQQRQMGAIVRAAVAAAARRSQELSACSS